MVEGDWEEDGSIGPQQGGSVAGEGLARLSDGAVATFSTPLAFDHVNTYCATDSSTGELRLKIDGVTAGTICGQPTAAVQAHVATSPLVLAGPHTVTFTCHGSCLIYGAEGTLGDSGVSIHNLAVSSAAAEWFGQNAPEQLAFLHLIPGGTQLIITDLLTNDAGLGYSVASYTSAMHNILAESEALHTQMLFVVPPVSNAATSSVFAAYTDGLLSAAHAHAVPVANIQNSWGLTFNPESGYWSADGVHPNTAGAASEYALIASGIHLD